MKLQKISALLMLLAYSFIVQAQNQRVRTVMPLDDQLAVQRGEIEAFKNHLYRFNLALEEGEQPSVEVLSTVLLDAMKLEISQVETLQKKKPSPARQTRLERQQHLVKTLTGIAFSSDKKSIENATLFNGFTLLMEQEYADLEADLK